MIKRKAQIFKPEGGDGRNGEEFLQSPEFSNKHARSLTDRPTASSPTLGKGGYQSWTRNDTTVTILAPSTLVRLGQKSRTTSFR